jgi:hypothetical protein
VHVEAGRPPLLMKDIYDAGYLPRLIALSHQAKYYVDYEDWVQTYIHFCVVARTLVGVSVIQPIDIFGLT